MGIQNKSLESRPREPIVLVLDADGEEAPLRDETF
jgi:hypothetical protein